MCRHGFHGLNYAYIAARLLLGEAAQGRVVVAQLAAKREGQVRMPIPTPIVWKSRVPIPSVSAPVATPHSGKGHPSGRFT